MFVTLLAFGLFAQGNQPTVEEELRVQYVLLDVVVEGRRGELVTDLDLSDFVVKDDGKKVDITYFDILDFRNDRLPDVENIPEEFREIAEIDAYQQIILATDFESVRFTTAQKALYQLRGFIRDLAPGNYRFNLYDLQRGSMTKGFISDPEQLLAAIDNMETRLRDGFKRQYGQTTDQPLLLSDNPRRRQSGTSGGMSNIISGTSRKLEDLERALVQCRDFFGMQNQQAELEMCINDSLGTFLEDQAFRTMRVIGELESLAYKFEDKPGLKTMMVISAGFATNMMQSAVDLATAYKGQTRADTLQSGFLTPYHQEDPEEALRRVIHACTRNRVIFYTFDIFNRSDEMDRQLGITFSGVNSGAVNRLYTTYSREVGEGLAELAETSGGKSYQLFGLEKAIAKVLEQNRYFYVLGYTSPGDEPGEYRKIKIKVKKRGADARHRQGYYAQ